MEHMHFHYFTNDKDFLFFIQYGYHDTDMPIHYHFDFSELVIVLSGTATHIVNDEQYFIKKGDVFVINSRTSHGYKNTSDFKICNIMYKSENLFKARNDIEKSAGYHALFIIEPFLAKKHNFNSLLKLTFSDFNKVEEIISCMIEEYQGKTQGYQTLIHSYFMELVVLFSRKYNLTDTKSKDNLINTAKSISYIENHFKEQITLPDIARKANISTRHFTRIFSATYKTTPMNYIVKLRMQYACSLLKKSNLNISDIAFESGFNDSNYFTRQFKISYGITPRQYRLDNK